ncbi:MAG: hypothetical protein OXP08_12140 [bacterium]|nr:hypothetical protein [bacterium]
MDWGQFAGLSGLMLVLFGWLKLDIRDLASEMRSGFAQVNERLRDHGERLARLEERAGPGGSGP